MKSRIAVLHATNLYSYSQSWGLGKAQFTVVQVAKIYLGYHLSQSRRFKGLIM